MNTKPISAPIVPTLTAALREALTWMTTHKRFNAVADGGPLDGSIEKARAAIKLGASFAADPAETWTDEQAEIIGAELARVLQLQRDEDHPDRWQTTGGNKTNKGIARTVSAIITAEGRT